MNEIYLDKRFEGDIPLKGIFEGISLIVDGSDCPIDRPALKYQRLNFFSGRSKENQYGKYNMKYTIGVQISTGEICFVHGPDQGRMHDWTSFLSELIAIVYPLTLWK